MINTANASGIHTDDGRGDKFGHRSRPICTGNTSRKLSEVRGRQKRPICRDGAFTRVNAEELNDWDLCNAGFTRVNAEELNDWDLCNAGEKQSR